jgi:hypothetical protein
MAKKMYYTEQEAAEKIRCDASELANFIRERKLRVFQDGARKMFRSDEVEALADSRAGEVQLSPADTSSDIISLTEADAPKKEDTILTSGSTAGTVAASKTGTAPAAHQSVFDTGELEVEAIDPLAKTQVAPSLEEQYGEGVGSGSGLLDLTREGDDTSLGAEVLDHIDMEGTVGPVGTSIVAAVQEQPEPVVPKFDTPSVEAPVTVMAPDPAAGLFSGLIVGSAILAILVGMVTLAAMLSVMPDYLEWMKNNLLIVLVASVVIVGAAAVVGFLVGKPAANASPARASA